jgi:lysophospholipase L1-like esterase
MAGLAGTTFRPAEFVRGAGWTDSPGSQGPLAQGGVGAPFNAAGALTFTAPNCNTFEVLAPIYSGGATLNASIDGGAVTPLNTNGANALGKLTISTGVVGTHTLSITCSGASGTAFVHAIRAYDSTKSEARITAYGSNGAQASQFAAVDALAGWNSDPELFTDPNGADPHLVVLGLGTNEHAIPVSVAVFKANMQTIINKIKAAGADCILLAPAQSSSGVPGTWINYRNAISELASSSGCGMVDMYNRWDSYAVANLAPYQYWADTDHPSNAGYADQGAAVAKAIILASG